MGLCACLSGPDSKFDQSFLSEMHLAKHSNFDKEQLFFMQTSKHWQGSWVFFSDADFQTTGFFQEIIHILMELGPLWWNIQL